MVNRFKLGIFSFQAERKLLKAEGALSKVEHYLKPADRQADPESITDEERFMFRKLGLRMKAFLLLGISHSTIVITVFPFRFQHFMGV